VAAAAAIIVVSTFHFHFIGRYIAAIFSTTLMQQVSPTCLEFLDILARKNMSEMRKEDQIEN
jgi:hypothetical protein